MFGKVSMNQMQLLEALSERIQLDSRTLLASIRLNLETVNAGGCAVTRTKEPRAGDC
jgi:hypothetical protein